MDTTSLGYWTQLSSTERGLILINYRINKELEEKTWNRILGRYRHYKPSQVYQVLFNERFEEIMFDLSNIIPDLGKIKRVYLDHSQIDNLQFVKHLECVEKISAVDTKISTLRGIENCEKLFWLDISHTCVTDLEILLNNRKLKRLIFCNCKVESISVVEQLKELYELSFSGTQVSTLSPLKHHPTLSVVRADEIELVDMDVLLTLTNMKYLSIVDCKNPQQEINAYSNLKKKGYLNK